MTRPQHDSHSAQEYSSKNEARDVLLGFGITQQVIDAHMELLAQMGSKERLNFPPMDVPQHELLSRGFRF